MFTRFFNGTTIGGEYSTDSHWRSREGYLFDKDKYKNFMSG
jgi:nuclear transport factor 2 (NTF2) superfamily protein